MYLTNSGTKLPNFDPIFFYLIIMTTFTINNKEYTHNELNLMWDFFTEDQWDHIISDIQDPAIAATIQQLWRASY